ncbi:MAG: glycoside hydrolase family 3 C-terminal domain-containing protein [Candidatus Glassbacteria bacterium]|nr:glycoside hydrolase family 3 C-terminal domain-containing protein [Candidatus Glassbacteria bacterium]
MREKRTGIRVFQALILVCLVGCVSGQAPGPLYKDASQPVEKRIDDLLSRMTLAEKVGQLNVTAPWSMKFGEKKDQMKSGTEKWALGTLVEGIGPAGGFFALASSLSLEEPGEQAEFINYMQRLAVEKTRLGIPLLQVEEGTHGLMCAGGTIFPEGPALGGTWDMKLIRSVYEAAAREGRSIGVHGLCTLVIEPIRDPRLGRNQEAYSEDPYLSSAIAREIVRGTQGDDISLPDRLAAFLCHFPGQSQPHAGLERGAMDISERMLREVFLPSWEAGIKEMGAMGVMATYPAIDGVPTHASRKILTGILREELGFEGIVVTEGGGLETLIYEHLAENQKEAGAQALEAGVDVSITYEEGFKGAMLENVAEGRVSVEDIDRSVRRLLRLKLLLGLFENPYVDPAVAERESHTQEHQELALEAAREGIVLLKNEGNLLPLDKNVGRIAVIGPNADHVRNQLGDYVAAIVTQDVVTVREGIEAAVSSSTRVDYVKGCNVIGSDLNEISAARQAAAHADVAVVVLGENEWWTRNKQGTVGEAFDSATLELTGLQPELIRAVVETGTPTVLVLINGRPLAIRWCAENVPAIVEAWNPGEKGGLAVADVLFGGYNPSGRLTATFPRHAGQLPVYYNYKPSKEFWIDTGWGKPYVDMEPTPLFEFGFGLSYTEFSYSNLRVTPQETGPGGSIQISADICNTGARAGTEVVQLYLRDELATVSTPVKQLKGFEKVALQPGEQRTVKFTVGPEHLALLNRSLKWEVEAGDFAVMVGASSEDIRLTGGFTVTP